MSEERRLTEQVMRKLTLPIPPDEINWKPQSVRDNRALMVAYVDARWVAERLDEATDGDWQFSCSVLHDDESSVVIKGTLTVCGVTREDIGEYHKARETDDMEMYKSAVSDALKRAAVLFGVGRQLYRMTAGWVAWDPQRRQPSEIDMQKLRSQASNDLWVTDPVTVEKFWQYTESQALSRNDVLAALGVRYLEDFRGSKKGAIDLINAYVEEQK